MDSKEAIVKLYEQWQEFQNDKFRGNETLDTYFNEQEKKCIFLSDAIIGITTYDDGLSAEFGKIVLDTLIQIKNRSTFEYIKDETNYKNYILSCNFIESWLEWGSSIRGAWFNVADGKIVPIEYLGNVGYEGDCVYITEDFMNWFIEFLSCDKM